MSADPLPMIQVQGTHREVGEQIGVIMKPTLERMLQRSYEGLPPGVEWKDMQLKGRLCLAHSHATYPQFVAEIEGVAEGSDLPFEELFLMVCEELWEPAAWHISVSMVPAVPAVPMMPRGCTDLIARGPATAGGATLLAHNNDLSPETEEDLVVLKVRAGDAPEFLGVSVGGLAYSAGFNSAGISMTGNAVSCSDIRPGVPRLLIARAILEARRLGEAMNACLLPLRASNYNNIIADQNGEVYSMEGSATDCEPIYIEDNIMAHANHYISWPMRRFEAHRNHIGGSIIRHNRATRLLRENYGRLSPELFQKLLADHADFPASICKHDGGSTTVFSIIINLNELRAWIGRGSPCQTTYVEHSLDPWNPPVDWSTVAV